MHEQVWKARGERKTKNRNEKINHKRNHVSHITRNEAMNVDYELDCAVF